MQAGGSDLCNSPTVYPVPCETALSAGSNLRGQSKRQPLPRCAHLLRHKQCPRSPKRIFAHLLQRSNANSTEQGAVDCSYLAPALLGAVGRCWWLPLPGYVRSSSADAGEEALGCQSRSFWQGSALSAAPGRASELQTSKGSTRGEENSDA